jgi:RHS repeat-associated protein
VATVKAYIEHADHLNTPRLVADATGTTVWRWDQAEPFGNNPADEDPDANSVAFDLPLRLPGQRYDKESGLHYNSMRDFDPALGRYVQADLIGLTGGLNVFAYANQSPISTSDSTGLLACEGIWIMEKMIIQGGLPSLTTCRCFWLCIPCNGEVLWSGDYFDLPFTDGLPFLDSTKPVEKATSVNAGPNDVGTKKRGGPRAGRAISGPTKSGVGRGGEMGTGNSCTCDFPGDETGCKSCTAKHPSGRESRTRH